MKEAYYWAVETWEWWCPQCWELNVETDDPTNRETLTCKDCKTEYVPIKSTTTSIKKHS
jgi:phage FluMu protein Com